MKSLYEQFCELQKISSGAVFESVPTEQKRGRKAGVKVGPYRPRAKRASLGAAVAPPMTPKERKRRQRDNAKLAAAQRVAILDMETDPFSDDDEMKIRPFLAVLYGHQFEPIVIWEENADAFAEKVIAAIEGLPGKYLVYAHNGGRFDFMFLVHKLRGAVAFKGRGIMSSRVGNHELRDSFNIIPERLANWQKDKFDYTKLEKKTRARHRKEIIDYCIADCRYLLEIVQKFIEGFGTKLTIGQAAMAELRKVYDVPKLKEGMDGYLRQFFFGGRVECLRGRGEFVGHYKLFDVNSLYPSVMAAFRHPVGDETNYTVRFGKPGPDTIFIDLECDNGRGALIAHGSEGETTSQIKRGRFRTTIWEYNVAVKYNLISDVKFNICVDCTKRSTFADFVVPLYDNRLRTKAELDRMKNAGLEGSAAFLDMKKDDIFYKLLLNNAYGKFAINPRRFKEHWLTDPDEVPPDAWFKSLQLVPPSERAKYERPTFEGSRYWIWEKPNPGFRFNNVGVAASITGAARAVLLEALQHAVDPIYCDTDSIICRDLGGVEISKTALGAWDLEDEFSRVIINGKKLYAVEHLKPKKRTPEQIADGADPRYTVKSKGVSRINWAEMDCLLHGMQLGTRNRAPTLDRFGSQKYVRRVVRATAPILDQR